MARQESTGKSRAAGERRRQRCRRDWKGRGRNRTCNPRFGERDRGDTSRHYGTP